jgi:hypothetical protein
VDVSKGSVPPPEFERATIVERTVMGLAKKAAKGEWTGGIRRRPGSGRQARLVRTLEERDDPGGTLFEQIARRLWVLVIGHPPVAKDWPGGSAQESGDLLPPVPVVGDSHPFRMRRWTVGRAPRGHRPQ